MGFLGKVLKPVEKVGRKLGLSRRGAKIGARLLSGDATSFLRSIQRSHAGGRFGKSQLPSFSRYNYITDTYNKLMESMGEHALREASRQSNTASSVRSQTRMPSSTAQRLDYNYRRLSDIT